MNAWESIANLIAKVLRFERRACYDERWAQCSPHDESWWMNCSRENRRHADRYRRKLHRLLHREGLA